MARGRCWKYWIMDGVSGSDGNEVVMWSNMTALVLEWVVHYNELLMNNQTPSVPNMGSWDNPVTGTWHFLWEYTYGSFRNKWNLGSWINPCTTNLIMPFWMRNIYGIFRNKWNMGFWIHQGTNNLIMTCGVFN